MAGMSRKTECWSRCPTSVGSTLEFVGSANRSGQSCSLCICNWFLSTTMALLWSYSFIAHVLEPGKGTQFCSLSELFGLLQAFHISIWLSGFSEFISSWKHPLWWELEFLCGEQNLDNRLLALELPCLQEHQTPSFLSAKCYRPFATYVRLFCKSMPYKWRVLSFNCHLPFQSHIWSFLYCPCVLDNFTYSF